MDLWKHFAVSTVLTIAMIPFFGMMSFLVLVGGFLVDIDHIIYYCTKFRKIEVDLFKIRSFYKEEIKTLDQYGSVVRAFHNIESLIIAFMISIPLGVGLLCHLLMDVIEEKQKFGGLRNYSLTYLLVKKR